MAGHTQLPSPCLILKTTCDTIATQLYMSLSSVLCEFYIYMYHLNSCVLSPILSASHVSLCLRDPSKSVFVVVFGTRDRTDDLTLAEQALMP